MTAPNFNPPGPIRPKAPRRSLAQVAMRAKLTEPVRLYLYGVALIVITGLALAGILTQEWATFATAAAAVVLAVVPAAAAIRASVWSEAGHIASLRKLHAVRDVQLALEETA